ncbi:unnamed protein product, partial [Laminaria digitata]
IQVHKPGVATALGKIEAQALTNVRIVQGDVITALSDHLEDRSLNECCIFFPDPFPGDSDADSRRLVRPLLLSLLSSKLRPGGALHLATDVEEYAEHIERVMSATTRPEKKKQTESSYSPPPLPGTFSPKSLEGFLARGEESPAQFFLSVDFSARRPRKAPGGGVQAAEMMGVEGACLCWEGGETLDRPAWRPLTSYERKAREAGRRVRDFSYRLEVP